MLEAAAVNPHDGEAQYQFGLIYQQRRQYGEAIRRFRNAIDHTQTDAHFQLGRIARPQGRLQDALAHFQTVVDRDEKHSQSEVLRELGGITSLSASTRRPPAPRSSVEESGPGPHSRRETAKTTVKSMKGF